MNAVTVPPLLDRSTDPEELRRLAEHDLPALADEVRHCLLTSVARSGGHLAAGLGAVELTIALHYTYDTPRDQLVWDVGHQCYPHKILTGRRAGLATIRRRGGLSGFLRREESPYDTFGAGHSSTAISAALGIAVANARLERPERTVAVIGDGGLTAGLAYEALQHAGASDVNLLVVLNDNGMSISPNVGALSDTLRHDTCDESRSASFFEALGFEYVGPCDGHDLPGLIRTLRTLRARGGRCLLHVRTRKGCGYPPAEADPVRYHGVTAFDVRAGIVAPASPPARTYTEVFGEWLCEAAARDPRIVAITPAMREGSGLGGFGRRFPDRLFDVGIAEQHSVTFAAGLACRGLKPVVAIYSTFLQRAYDQLIHDVALQKLPVLFAIDRGGLVGPDGATHTGSYDLTYLRCVPGLVLMTPADGPELRAMLETGIRHEGIAAVRYPRATASADSGREPCTAPFALGASETRRAGAHVALLAFGTLLQTALEVGDELDATVIDMRFVKPLDARAVLEAARTHTLLVTMEENVVAGGAGSAVNECLAALGSNVPVLNLGLPDRFVEHGTREESLRDAGLDRDAILHAIRVRLPGIAGRSTGPRRTGGAEVRVLRTR